MKICNYQVIVKIDKRRKDRVAFRFVDQTIYVYTGQKLSTRWLKEVITNNLEQIISPPVIKKDIVRYDNIIRPDGVLYVFGNAKKISYLKKQKEKCFMENDCLYVYSKSQAKMKSLVDNFIIQSLQEIIVKSTEKYAKELSVNKPTYDFKEHKHAFAVCIPKRRHLEFSLKIISLTEDQIDYVVAHEMSHLLHANHSPSFYETLKGLRPDSDQLKKALKKVLVTINY